MSQIRKLKSRVEPWRKLLSDVDDLEAMFELATESGEQSDEDEVSTMLSNAKETFEKLNILNLLSGEVDQNDAFLTVHAGAGGTEACDWADMLLRMYTMFCDKNDYKYEIIDKLKTLRYEKKNIYEDYTKYAVFPFKFANLLDEQLDEASLQLTRVPKGAFQPLTRARITLTNSPSAKFLTAEGIISRAETETEISLNNNQITEIKYGNSSCAILYNCNR